MGRTMWLVGLVMAVALALMASDAVAKKPGGTPGGGGGGEDDPPPAAPALLWTDTSGRSGATWEVRVVDADGANAATLVTATGVGLPADPCWSPDGVYVVYRGDDSSGDHALFVATVDGTSTVQIRAGRVYDPTWSPDVTADGTERIVFAEPHGGPYDLCTVTPTGTGYVNLTNTASRHETYPTWSPDGSKVAARYADYDTSGAVTERGVVIYAITAVDGVLTASVDEELSDADLGLTDIAFLDWSRAGSRIACSAVGGTYTDRDIWIIDVGTSVSTTNVTKSSGVLEKWPTWSPDGAAIAHTRQGNGRKDTGIFLVAADGDSEATGLIQGGGEHYRGADWRR